MKANLGRPWLNKQITKIYRQKLSALTASYFYRQKLCKIIFANLKNLFSVICGFRFPVYGFRIPDCGFRIRVPIPDSGFRFRFRISVSGFLVLGLPLVFEARHLKISNSTNGKKYDLKKLRRRILHLARTASDNRSSEAPSLL